ncbi:hypothetical protein [Lichenifustis flavocetrariae]|uniref:Uncharacterized protein n=1 Tax=Lichenifustis flavocetrariae TaxID=2949735 RepID=A0AA41YWV1_9HYPH|nr:hypothetical protein [Lichenifustis flavocetrariae]MCW6506413.1 hypothetical protein [Lichenifustis flavocetrariae]
MPPSLSAEFETRRDAEMAIEHIVQEQGVDRNAVIVVAASSENSAGTRVAGSDVENGGDKVHTESRPALDGRIKVSVKAEDGLAEKVLTSFKTYKGRQVD